MSSVAGGEGAKTAASYKDGAPSAAIGGNAEGRKVPERALPGFARCAPCTDVALTRVGPAARGRNEPVSAPPERRPGHECPSRS